MILAELKKQATRIIASKPVWIAISKQQHLKT